MKLFIILTYSVNTSKTIAKLANKSSMNNPQKMIVGNKYIKEQKVNTKWNLLLICPLDNEAKNDLSAVMSISSSNFYFFLYILMSNEPQIESLNRFNTGVEDADDN